MRKLNLVWLACLGACLTMGHSRAGEAVTRDAEFGKLAEEFLGGYLAWRPGLGVALGLHEYDGRVTDFSPASIRLEHARLKRFDRRLAAFPTKGLASQTFYDFRILRAAVRKQLFHFDDLESFSRNPMTYAGAIDVNIYVKRDFAPIEERVRYIIAILDQAPGTFAAAEALCRDCDSGGGRLGGFSEQGPGGGARRPEK
jgi:hypothetical protein